MLSTPPPNGEQWGSVIHLFAQELLEDVAFIFIMGLLPVGAHWLFSLEKAGDNRDWVAAELYLFVMMICGQAAADAFRTPGGIVRTVVFVAGALGVLAGAGAYGLLYVHPRAADAVGVEAFLQAQIVHIIVGAGGGYAAYRGIRLFGIVRAKMAKSTRATALE